MIRLKTILPLLFIAALGTANAADQTPGNTLGAKYPRLSWGPLNQAVTGVVKGALAEADGITITSQDLAKQRAQMTSPAKERYATYEFPLLENTLVSRLLDKEAREWALKNSIFGLQGEELMRQYATSLIGQVTVSDDEALQFYKDFTDMLGGATYEQAKESIKSYLKDQKVQTLLNKHLMTLSSRHSVRISDVWAKQQYAKWIKTPVEAARRSGKPTMAKFGSTACKPCLMMAPIIKELEKQYAGKLNVLDINTDKEPILSAYYVEEAIPLVIFYDKDGKEISRTVGFRDKTAIEAELSKIGVK